MRMKRIILLAIALGGCASKADLRSPTSPEIELKIDPGQRLACEITAFPSHDEIHKAMTAPDVKDREAYVESREVKHNGALAQCNLRGDALVKEIDAANASWKALSR